MRDLILTTLIFMAPAYAANMAPVIAAKLQLPFGVPISARHLGPNKTWRGVYTAVLAAAGMLWLLNQLPVAPFSGHPVWLLALTMGGGAIAGDAFKSLFKRRLGIASGRPFFPFDQIDFVLGSLLATTTVMVVSPPVIVTALLITPLLHFLTNVSAYFLGIKKVWW